MQPGLITPPREERKPPASLNPPPGSGNTRLAGNKKIPPTYVYTQRREPDAPPSFLMAPWDNYDQRYDLRVYWQDAPDPIRQSNFYSAGNKIHPWANMPIVTHLAIGSIEAVSEQTFRIGKLLGYMRRPMYAGSQQPSQQRSNIQEAVPTTYGSQFQVTDVQGLGGPATAAGFVLPTSSPYDGYPY